MAEARRFAARLAEAGLTIYFEPEYYSSVEARRHADDSFVDARAATVILNRYLEKVHPPSRE
jgi:RNase H-fold protein (predicted Holliday junction resolvase)